MSSKYYNEYKIIDEWFLRQSVRFTNLLSVNKEKIIIKKLEDLELFLNPINNLSLIIGKESKKKLAQHHYLPDIDLEIKDNSVTYTNLQNNVISTFTCDLYTGKTESLSLGLMYNYYSEYTIFHLKINNIFDKKINSYFENNKLVSEIYRIANNNKLYSLDDSINILLSIINIEKMSKL